MVHSTGVVTSWLRLIQPEICHSGASDIAVISFNKQFNDSFLAGGSAKLVRLVLRRAAEQDQRHTARIVLWMAQVETPSPYSQIALLFQKEVYKKNAVVVPFQNPSRRHWAFLHLGCSYHSGTAVDQRIDSTGVACYRRVPAPLRSWQRRCLRWFRSGSCICHVRIECGVQAVLLSTSVLLHRRHYRHIRCVLCICPRVGAELLMIFNTSKALFNKRLVRDTQTVAPLGRRLAGFDRRGSCRSAGHQDDDGVLRGEPRGRSSCQLPLTQTARSEG